MTDVNELFTDDQIEAIFDHWESIVALMDPEIREAVHNDLAPCSETVFLAEYNQRHAVKYGAEFEW
jgi:hypothetical protein